MEIQKLNFIGKISNQFNSYYLNSGLLDSEEVKEQKIALEKFTQLGLPTVKNEEWKYTNVGFLNRSDFSVNFAKFSEGISTEKEKEILNAVKSIKLDGFEVLVILNGVLYTQIIGNDSFSVKKLSSVSAKKVKNQFESLNNKTEEEKEIKDNPFKLSFEFLPTESIQVDFKANLNQKEKLQIIHYYTNDFSGQISNSQVFLSVGLNTEVEVVETFLAKCKNTLSFNEFYVSLAKNAKIMRTKVEHFENNYLMSFSDVYQKRDSEYTDYTFTLSGNFVRNNLRTNLLEDNSTSHFYGLALATENNVVDNHTKVDHYSPNCQSNELYKTLVFDNAVGVFNGRVLVRKDAQKTNAYQSSKNIVLSDSAKLYTKPELEIYADDVKCSHGASTGHINEEAMFYLQSRGIGKELAKSILLYAFAEDIVERVENESLREYINSILTEKLKFSF